MEEGVDVLDLVVLCVVDLQEEGQCLFIDLRLSHHTDHQHEVLIQLQLMHLDLPFELDLLDEVSGGEVLAFLVYLDHQVLEKVELLQGDRVKVVLWEQFHHKVLKLI